jgi:GTP-binding protein
MLRKLGKPVSLAVNKIDSQKRENLAHEFHALGFEHLFPVSAEHHLGLDDLLEHITATFPIDVARATKAEHPVKESTAAEHAKEAPRVKVAIIGRPNVGKSTLLNALIGSERSIVSPIAGTTRDAVDETMVENGVEYVFIDTAGIRRKGKTKLMAEKLSVVMARRHLRMCNVALFVVDASEGVLALDTTIAGYAHEEGRAIVIAVNKWDVTIEKDRRKFLEELHDRFKFLDYAPVVLISAQKKQGTRGLFALIKTAYDSANKHISTGALNRFVSELKWEYRMKIFYITQGSVRPPTFIVFTDKAGDMHFSAERFLINRLREKFGFVGTPFVIKTKRR